MSNFTEVRFIICHSLSHAVFSLKKYRDLASAITYEEVLSTLFIPTLLAGSRMKSAQISVHNLSKSYWSVTDLTCAYLVSGHWFEIDLADKSSLMRWTFDETFVV